MVRVGLALILILVPSILRDGDVPYVLRNTKLAQPVKHTDEQCLASAIKYEAGGELLEGQRAVYEVILHRARAARKGLCAVIKAPKQFSWYGSSGKPILPLTGPMKDLLKRVKNHPKILDSSFKWFHAVSITPKHENRMDCRVIGGHKFCKEREESGGRQ